MENQENKINRPLIDLLKAEKRPLIQAYLEEKIGKNYILGLTESGVIRINCEYWATSAPSFGGTRYSKTDRYYWLKEELENFWLNEIKIILEEKGKEIELKELKTTLSISFINYFALKHNTYSDFEDIDYFKSDVGIDHTYSNLKVFLENDNKIFYLKTDSRYGSNALIKVGLKSWLDSGTFYEPKKIIRSQIVLELKKYSARTLPLKDLTFRINRNPFSPGIPKPISESLVEEIIKQDEDRFKYDIYTGSVELVDDLEYLIKVINKKQFLLKEFDYTRQQPGFLAFTFIGESFPLKEAQDYVSTRPIIFIKSVNDLSKEFDTIIEDRDFLPSEFIENLRAILQNEIKITDWLNENVTISFIAGSVDDVKKLGNQLIAKLSPIFNVMNNPGNLFQYTLKTKLDEYYRKFPPKELSQ